MRPGFIHFIEELSGIFELFIYTNGLEPYVKEVIKCTPLCNIKDENIKCRHNHSDSVTKVVSHLIPYAKDLAVIVDDCEGNPQAERVWPKNADHVFVVKPYDSLEASEADSTVLDEIRHSLMSLTLTLIGGRLNRTRRD